MTPPDAPESRDKELARLREEVARLRKELEMLHAQATLTPEESSQVAPGRDGRLAQMREANENLLIAALRSQVSAEASERSSVDKEQFLAMLAHELRNPLAPIVGALAILGTVTHADPKLPWIHDVMKRQVDLLRQLLNDLLEVSRMTGGKVVLKKRPIETSEFMLSAVEMSQPLFLSRQQKLALNLPAEPLMIEGDPTRLAQIFANLLNNASKYTHQAGSIWFSAERRDDAVVVSVKDDGTGILAEALPRIFDIFTQEVRSMDRSQGGLGIGLTVVRSLVELHGGTIVASSPGEGLGSTFEVTFPLLKSHPGAALVPSHAGGAPGETLRIALIENDVEANESLKSELERMGHEVLTAVDGIRGVAAVKEGKPDLVLTDIGLPGLDGYQAIARLKEVMDSMPVMIALIPCGEPENHVRSAGFDHHLSKPVDIEALRRLLEGQAQRISALKRGAP